MSAWLPPDWFKSVVMIVQFSERTGESPSPRGTAFLFDNDGVNTLVTAKHMILSERGAARSDLGVAANKKGSGISLTPIQGLASTWKYHSDPKVDLALAPVQLESSADVKFMNMDFFMDFSEILEGDDLFFLGFPLGLTDSNSIRPIVRAGIVASKREDSTLLIDANVVPGNSGGPVFKRPFPFQFVSGGVSMVFSSPTARFLGIISGYLPDQDIAVSLRTGRQRMMLEENSGLGVVFSTKHIREILRDGPSERQSDERDEEKS